jgi:hypothetical protein
LLLLLLWWLLLHWPHPWCRLLLLQLLWALLLLLGRLLLCGGCLHAWALPLPLACHHHAS